MQTPGLWMAALLLGHLFGFAVTLLLAARLDSAEFEAYVTAGSVFLLLLALAPVGADKVALRVLPLAVAEANAMILRQYLGFAAHRALIGSALASLAALIWAFWLVDLPPPSRSAVTLACLALPIGVAVLVAQAMLTGVGQGSRALIVSRTILPGATLALLGLVFITRITLSGAGAIAIWTAGWACALLLLAWYLRSILARGGPLRPDPALSNDWSGIARPMWTYRILVGLRLQMGLIALVWFDASPTQIGAFAAAQAIAGLPVAFVTASNRIYASSLALMIDQNRDHAIAELLAQRMRWVALVLVGFAVVLLMFSGPLLSAFQPGFVEPGTTVLFVLASSSVLPLLFALASTELQFRGRTRTVLGAMGGAVLAQILLLVLLVPSLGPIGAAVAFSVPTVLLYALFGYWALRTHRKALSGTGSND